MKIESFKIPISLTFIVISYVDLIILFELIKYNAGQVQISRYTFQKIDRNVSKIHHHQSWQFLSASQSSEEVNPKSLRGGVGGWCNVLHREADAECIHIKFAKTLER